MWRLVLNFAASEVRHERLFSIGVSLAVCSVLTPTLLLWGVQNGIVTSMHDKLMKDPRVRELRPSQTVDIAADWIDTLKKDIRVEYVVPSVRQISLHGRVKLRDAKEWVQLDDIIPTGAGDPLGQFDSLDWASREIPVPCMISQRLSESLIAENGAILTLEQTRIVNEKTVRDTFFARVIRIIPQSLSPSSAVYLPLGVIERIEGYKDGLSIPEFDWKSSVNHTDGRFQALAILVAPGSADVALDRLKPLFPEAEMSLPSTEQLAQYLRVVPDSPGSIILVRYLHPDIDLALFSKAQNTLEAIGNRIIPFVAPVDTIATSTEGRSYGRITLRTRADQWLPAAAIRPLFQREPRSVVDVNTMMLKFRLPMDKLNSSVDLLIQGKPELVVEISPHQAAFVGAALIAPITYSERTGELFRIRQKYAGFRMYAKTLDAVRDLRLLSESKGISVYTSEDKIEQVKKLGSGLTRLFALIAGMSVIGGFGALFASLYLAVERGKRQFCILRVLGMSHGAIRVAIIVQGAVLVTAGAAFATLFYLFGASILQQLFGKMMEPGDVFCQLRAEQIGILWVCALACGVVVAILASLRLRGLDAAVVARNE